MNFVRSLSSARIVWPAAAFILSGPAAAIVSAQAPAVGLDIQDLQQALALLSQGKFAEAAKLYEGIPQKYPTSSAIPEANFRLGYANFMLGEYDKGVAALQKNVQGKNVPPDVLELSYSFIPQLLAAKAARLDAADPNQKTAYQAAIKEFETFIAKYPQSEEVESANYGKARALFAILNYEDAAAALRTNIQKFPQSPSLMDTQFMLALVLGTEGNVGMSKATASDPASVAAFEEANKLLGDIIGKRTDLALANDAQFQLGEMLAARGNYEVGEAKKPILTRALTAYRAVLPKETVVKVQEDRIAAIRAAIAKGAEVNQFKRLQRFLEKEQEKAVNLQARADQTVTAKLKSAQIFLTLEKFDEARVLLHFIESSVEDPEQKKQVAYFLAVTYAVQNLTEKAVQAYDKFMAAYKGDPIAENLPLLIGAAFLAHNDSDSAIKYFKAQVELYPKSKLAPDATMRQALALIPLERYDEALAVLKKFLAGNPTKEQGAAAELGVANIYQKTNKGEDALKTYTSIRDKYPESVEGEQSAYWVGALTLSKGDAKTAAAEMKAFLTKYPKSELVPASMLILGQAQASIGDKAAAIATFKDLATKYPTSEPAPIGYFQRATLYQKDNELAEVKAVMKAFTEAYPNSERLFGAYDYIAQVQIAEKGLREAIGTYEEFLKKRPKDPEAAKALIKLSTHWKKYGEDQGPYLSLNPEQREQWRKGIDESISAAEKLLEGFPDSTEVSLALQNLLGCQKLMMRVKLKTEKEVDDYFQNFAQKFESKPSTKNKILFAYAGLVGEKNEAKAFDLMKSAFDEKLVYAPIDLDLYGTALLKKKNLDVAAKVYGKLAKDYPLPPNTAPEKAPRIVSDAQSISIYGMAKILQGQDKKADAAKKFEELKTKYPFSSKLLEAEFGIAEGEIQGKNFESALKRLGTVVKSNVASPNLRARAMLLVGKMAEEKGDLDTAINNYIKVGTLFPAETELAPEGFWRGAQLIEKKLNQ